MLVKFLFTVFLFLFSCSYHSVEEVTVDVNEQLRKIAFELSSIKTKIELERSVPVLSKKFCKLSELIIIADRLENFEQSIHSGDGAALLQKEMIRLYQIHGARELIEKAQLKGLKALEKYEETKASFR